MEQVYKAMFAEHDRGYKPGRLSVTLMTFPCVPPDIPVYTENGPIPISDVDKGTIVRSMSGVSKVQRKMSREYEGEIVELRARYLRPVELTKEHPVLVMGRHETCKRGHHTMWGLEGFKWKKASDLEPLIDCVVIPERSRENEVMIDFSNYRQRNEWSVKGLKGDQPLTEELAELCGWYVAEGYINKQKDHYLTNFCLGKKEKSNIRRIQALIQKIGYSSSVQERRTSKVITSGSPVLARFFEENFGKLARGKRVPDFMFTAPKKIKEAFLNGYLMGDGHKSKSRGWEARTCSEKLAIGIQALASSMGIVTSVYSHKRKEGTIEGRKIPPNISFNVSRTRSMPSRYYREDTNFFYYPILGIKRKKYEGEVFNLETSDHTYALPFVVHNCERHAVYSILAPEEGGIRPEGLIRTWEGSSLHKTSFLGKEKEIELEWDGISGRADEYDPAEAHLLELKSTRWIPRNEARPHHSKQVNYYAVLLEQNGKPVKKAGILYINPDSCIIKHYPVPLQSTDLTKIEMLELKGKIMKCVENRILPPRNVVPWEEGGSRMICGYCNFFSRCFREEVLFGERASG